MFEGKLPEVEKVAVTLDKELNTDIEFDVEIIKTSNETLSSSTTTCPSELSKLTEIPFPRATDELDELAKSIDDIFAHENGTETETADDDYGEQHSSILKSTTASENKAKKILKVSYQLTVMMKNHFQPQQQTDFVDVNYYMIKKTS
ncbi:unnamed protein product [Didymodactylos carnosus]|uniref:Uncharacterized protein n=1 Tax=Didymodactylos carnosus TaxID=1234261 RepID=A0A8S2UH52_9BILA|nr:unnamed protein product [Didymodactylos carnosus]CAF4487228.1 unnamed protein product [Didymodactylos carnosus]